VTGKKGIKGEGQHEEKKEPSHRPSRALKDQCPKDDPQPERDRRGYNLPACEKNVFPIKEIVKRSDETEKGKNDVIPGKLLSGAQS